MFTYSVLLLYFFYTATSPRSIYSLSLHDALPISAPRFNQRRNRDPFGSAQGEPRHDRRAGYAAGAERAGDRADRWPPRSEEHTSELQSPCKLVCRLLLEKKKSTVTIHLTPY